MPHKGDIRSDSPSGVIFAHGDSRSGYSVYLDQEHLCFTACVNEKRTVVRDTSSITDSASFEAKWSLTGEMFLKVNGKLVGKADAGILRREPDDSIHIGADQHQPVGDYTTPKYFSGTIENLTFTYPNGT